MSSTTDPGSRSAAAIEREVEQTRAGLTNTLDELRERASPGQLFEQALDYARSSGGNEFVRNLGASVRDNPLPLLLIGAGIGWLMLAGGNRTGGTTTSMTAPPNRSIGTGSARVRVYGGEAEASGPMTGRASTAIGAARDNVAGAADQAIDKVGQAYRSAADAASAATESIRDAAGSVADSVRGAAAAVTDQVAGSGQEMHARAGELGDQAHHGVTWLMREQPLVLGAIGVALGAAVGALLPGTEAEDRLMGQTRDAVADRVQATAKQGYDRLKDTAGEHVDRAKAAIGQAAGEAGSTGRVGSALNEAVREVRQVARDATHDLASEARATIEARPLPQEATAPASTPGSPRVGPA
jgi:Protein of unknown function (DUF3618)